MDSGSLSEKTKPTLAGDEPGMVGELSIVEFIDVLRRYRYVVAGVAGAALVVSVLLALLMTPIYRAEVLLSPTTGSAEGFRGLLDSMGVGAIGSLLGVGGGGSTGGPRAARQEAIATLTSPYFTQTFIRENNLLPVLFDDLWDPVNEEWLVESPDDVPTPSDGYEFFSEAVQTVTVDDITRLVTMTIDWKDPKVAADWANQLVRRVNDLLRGKAIREAELTIDYLNKELEKTSIVALQQAIYFMIEQQINARTVANVREEYAFKVINPAIAPDEDKFVRPNRMFIICLGLALGVLTGVFAAFFVRAIKKITPQLAKL